MSDPITVIKDQRRHLIQRLVTRSPLLRFLPGAYREDVFTLFEDITPNTPQPHKETVSKRNASTTPIGLLSSILSSEPKPSTIFNPQKATIAKCRKIRQEAEEYLHATGQDSLYVGYPLIFTPVEAGRFLLAPLFLWPVSLIIKTDQILVDRLRNEDERLPDEIFAPPLEARFNRIFKAWLWHETGIELDWENGAEEVTFKNLPQQINRILKPWSECERQYSGSDLYPLTPNPQSYFKALAEKGERPRLLESAVIGLASFKGQALLDDLDQLEKKLQEDPYNCGLLKYFIFPRNTQFDDPAPIPPETHKWLVTHSDHSQESAIWQARKSNLMVLQGPPGTGKSQTIVNLIADALQAKKKVLVVCQKRAALDVVLKRMRAVGLGDLAELIDDPSKDRARVIKAIKAIEDNLVLNYPSMNRYQICNDLLHNEEQLDTHTIALNETYNGTRPRYADLLAMLHLAKTKENIHILRDFNAFYEKFYEHNTINTIEDLEEIQQEIRSFTALYQQCDYENNSWHNISSVRQVSEQIQLIVIVG